MATILSLLFVFTITALLLIVVRSQSLTVHVSGPAVTGRFEDVVYFREHEGSLNLNCTDDGVLNPRYTWWLDGESIVPDERFEVRGGHLRILYPSQPVAGSYQCSVEDKHKSTAVNLRLEPNILDLSWHIGILGTSLGMVIFALGTEKCYRNRKKNLQKTDSERNTDEPRCPRVSQLNTYEEIDEPVSPILICSQSNAATGVPSPSSLVGAVSLSHNPSYAPSYAVMASTLPMCASGQKRSSVLLDAKCQEHPSPQASYELHSVIAELSTRMKQIETMFDKTRMTHSTGPHAAGVHKRTNSDVLQYECMSAITSPNSFDLKSTQNHEDSSPVTQNPVRADQTDFSLGNSYSNCQPIQHSSSQTASCRPLPMAKDHIGGVNNRSYENIPENIEDFIDIKPIWGLNWSKCPMTHTGLAHPDSTRITQCSPSHLTNIPEIGVYESLSFIVAQGSPVVNSAPFPDSCNASETGIYERLAFILAQEKTVASSVPFSEIEYQNGQICQEELDPSDSTDSQHTNPSASSKRRALLPLDGEWALLQKAAATSESVRPQSTSNSLSISGEDASSASNESILLLSPSNTGIDTTSMPPQKGNTSSTEHISSEDPFVMSVGDVTDQTTAVMQSLESPIAYTDELDKMTNPYDVGSDREVDRFRFCRRSPQLSLDNITLDIEFLNSSKRVESLILDREKDSIGEHISLEDPFVMSVGDVTDQTTAVMQSLESPIAYTNEFDKMTNPYDVGSDRDVDRFRFCKRSSQLSLDSISLDTEFLNSSKRVKSLILDRENDIIGESSV